MAKTKHAFVDDNPYLVYSPKAEMTYDGNGGSETGGKFVVTLTYDDVVGDYVSDKNAEEIYNAFKTGMECIAISDDSSSENETNDSIYYLVSVIAQPSENDTVYAVLFTSSSVNLSADNKATCNITTVSIQKAGDTELCASTTYNAVEAS